MGTRRRGCTSIIGESLKRCTSAWVRVGLTRRLSGYALVTLMLLTAHLGGAHSTWALGQMGMQTVRVTAFWIGLPLAWTGMEVRSRCVVREIP